MSTQVHTARRIDSLLAEYGESHGNPTNKLIHWFAVPSIAWSVLAILWYLPTPASFEHVPYLNWATIMCALAVIYYLTLSVPLALGMIAFSVIALAIASYVEANASIPLVYIAVTVFVFAWVFQFA